jgi:hypothetical protein
MTIQNTQFSLIDISGAFHAIDIKPPVLAGPEYSAGPAPRGKLSEGWVNTSQGDVFISPGGVAWVVERRRDTLVSVPVKLSKDDIIGKSAAERRVEAIQKQTRRARSKGRRTTSTILTVGAVSKANSGVLESS